MKKPVKEPKTQQVLSRYVDAYAREVGADVGRVRRRISYMAIAGALRDADFAEGERPRFGVKGGVALELRLPERARATRDLDLILNQDDGDLVEALDGALARGHEAFAFRRKTEAHLMPNGAVRTRYQVEFRGRPWSTVEIDVARREGGETEVELVPGMDLRESFGIAGADEVPCLSLRHHLAQKLHGATRPPREGAANERFRDVVDLLLLREFVVDYAALREACEAVFGHRGTHAWPPAVEAPEHWREPFARMAGEIGLPVTDVDQAVEEVRVFVAKIVGEQTETTQVAAVPS